MNAIAWLQSWYISNRSTLGRILIEPVDNPGWTIEVDLTKTPYQGGDRIVSKNSPPPLDYSCIIKDGQFLGFDSTLDLEDILHVLHSWVDPDAPLHPSEKSEPLRWLQEWFAFHCDEDWEHCTVTKIFTTDEGYWDVLIDFTDTELEDREFQDVNVRHSEHDWYSCTIVNNRYFKATCGPQNLEDVLRVFMNWGQHSQ